MKGLYVFFLRMVAKRLLLPALEVVQTNYPLTVLTRIHDEVVQDGVMNVERLLYFVRYAEEYQLTRDEWDALFTFLELSNNLFLNIPSFPWYNLNFPVWYE